MQDQLTVKTTYGIIRGEEERGVCVWRGIPYAQAPMGALRFHHSRPPQPWTGVRETVWFGKAAPHNERAQLAIDIFIREIIRYIGGYAAILGGLDAIAFTGGIGENSETVRSRVLDAFAFMGLKKGETRPCAALDPSAGGKIITAPDSALHAFVIPANEELGIARKVFSKLQ